MIDYFKRPAIESKAERKSWSCLFTVREHFVIKICRWLQDYRGRRMWDPYWGQKWVEMTSVVPKGSWEV